MNSITRQVKCIQPECAHGPAVKLKIVSTGSHVFVHTTSGLDHNSFDLHLPLALINDEWHLGPYTVMALRPRNLYSMTRTELFVTQSRMCVYRPQDQAVLNRTAHIFLATISGPSFDVPWRLITIRKVEVPSEAKVKPAPTPSTRLSPSSHSHVQPRVDLQNELALAPHRVTILVEREVSQAVRRFWLARLLSDMTPPTHLLNRDLTLPFCFPIVCCERMMELLFR